MALIFAGTYYYVSWMPPQAPQSANIQLYADINMRAMISENQIWWKVKATDINYTKTVYAYNPNSYNVTLTVFWEAFPEEMTQYCEWRTEAKEVLQPLEIAEIKLYLIVKPNDWLGISAFEGDVLTQIGGETR